MGNTRLTDARFRARSIPLAPGWLAVALLVGGLSPAAQPSRAVLFNRDVRPVLSDNCLPCHGFDAAKRKADLRLDIPEGATALHQGRQAIVPGHPEASELWRRVTSADPKVAMPPPESRKKLKPEQISLLRQWIAEGARYQQHWAFVPPVRPEPPPVSDARWSRNDIDRFILSALEQRHLEPSPVATLETLIRRVTLDLTGLPPTLSEVDTFLADKAPDAYERLVDRLLESPRYGENMARPWLDLARYGDTHGLHLDNERSMWPYRDWVVSAFNTNLSFDQFTIWQLAGDLLPHPTREQLVASGFNRCNVSTSEGGAIDEEFQVRYAVDRVETTSTAFMGLTMGCAVCHDHKLDPISQKEFYEVFAIFNNIAEKAMDGNALLPPPSMPLPTAEQQATEAGYDARLKQLEDDAREIVAKVAYTDPATLTNAPPIAPADIAWVDDDFPAGAEVSVNEGNEPYRWVTKAEGPVLRGERSIRRVGKGLHQVFFPKAVHPLKVGPGDKVFAYVYLDPKDLPKAIMLQYHTDEWRHRAVWGDVDAIPYGAKGTTERVRIGDVPGAGTWVRLEVPAARLGLKPGAKITGLAFTQFDGTCYWDNAGIVSVDDPARDPARSLLAWEEAEQALGEKSTAPAGVKEILRKKPPQRSPEEQAKLREHFLLFEAVDIPALEPLRAEMIDLREKRKQLEKQIPSTMISKELEKPRHTWVLTRGQYDKHGEEVGPGVPAILPPLPKAEVTNRLTFARWLVDPQHPLTARVTVNRLWQQFFGVGLVKTAEDFGTRGEWPSHPELLDWLATEFIRSGWDLKHMVRLMVTSATYRQASRVTRRLQQADPDNRLLARGPRCRLDAEVLRDSALFAGGLLNFKRGGRGVHPYQPPGIWEAVGYTTSNTARYSQDHGDDLYRRSLYTFWKRTAPPPSMTTFDAPSREQCRARRERTNTPLQALLMLNDPQYFEAARHLGYRMLHEGGATDSDRLRYGFRLVTARFPEPCEQEALMKTLDDERALYRGNHEAAKKVVAVGESAVPADLPAEELAAWALVGNLLLNLDEVVTKN